MLLEYRHSQLACWGENTVPRNSGDNLQQE